MNKLKTVLVKISEIFTIFFGLFFSCHTYALEITVKAQVVTPPCIVNNNNIIDVDFGDAVYISKIDGQNYRIPVPYTIQCDASAPNALKLQIKGSGASFNSDALQTSQNELGVIFFQNGQPLALNSKIDVSYLALPAFEAAPIKAAGAQLTTGDFTAGATLAIYYN